MLSSVHSDIDTADRKCHYAGPHQQKECLITLNPRLKKELAVIKMSVYMQMPTLFVSLFL